MSQVPLLIVDGYNVIFSTPQYRTLAEDDLDAARAALVSDVAACADGEWRATVVFDAANNPTADGAAHEVAGVTVVFSRFGTDADTVIERLARTAREAGAAARVVTSDAATQWTVLGGSVARMPSGEFADELAAGGREWEEHSPAGRREVRLEDRVDARTRAELWRWARGLE